MREFYKRVFTIITLILFVSFNKSGALEPPKPQTDNEEVSTCTVCRNLVKSFHKVNKVFKIIINTCMYLINEVYNFLGY